MYFFFHRADTNSTSQLFTALRPSPRAPSGFRGCPWVAWWSPGGASMTIEAASIVDPPGRSPIEAASIDKAADMDRSPGSFWDPLRTPGRRCGGCSGRLCTAALLRLCRDSPGDPRWASLVRTREGCQLFHPHGCAARGSIRVLGARLRRPW